ncbi:MAG TPA: hypothetical protein VFQ91_02990 [Bryobacteraceae bacterium]|nr:hypothetical protein [Bryobacteraceae bacterium]
MSIWRNMVLAWRILGILLMSLGLFLTSELYGMDRFAPLPITDGSWWRLQAGQDESSFVELWVSDARATASGVVRARLTFRSGDREEVFTVQSSTAGIFLSAIQPRGGDLVSLPAPSPMFPSGEAGESWISAIGKVTLVESSLRIHTAAGEFGDVAHYRLYLESGRTQEWFLSSTAGIVRFQDDTAPYDLVAYLANSAPPVATGSWGSCPKLGMDLNPAETVGFSDAAKDATANSLAEWVRYVDIAAPWSELEPAPGRYAFGRVAVELARAKRIGAAVSFTIKVVDGPNRGVPADLMNTNWDDARLLLRWRQLLAALSPYLRGQVEWLHLANEVDTFFLAAPPELSGFEVFLTESRTHLNTVWPAARVGLVHAFDAVRKDDSTFRRLRPYSNHIGFTYYGMDGLKTRQIDTVSADIEQMQLLAGGLPLVLTELGHPSELGDQAGFYQAVGNALGRSSGRIEAARFFQLHDMPKSVAAQFAAVYGYQGAPVFVEFLSSLGMHDADGRPKPVWTVYQSLAARFRQPEACTTN